MSSMFKGVSDVVSSCTKVIASVGCVKGGKLSAKGAAKGGFFKSIAKIAMTTAAASSTHHMPDFGTKCLPC
jgi:hypothetical protein